MSPIHWEAVPREVATVYRRLSSELSDTDFYLAGGTALALQEGHRISVDLDLFSATFDAPSVLFERIRRSLAGAVATLVSGRTLYVEASGCTASFFGYDYPLIEPPVQLEPGLLPVAHPDDIAAMKLAAIASRGSRKDFVDVWTLVSRHRPLGEYLTRYREKFRQHDVGHVVRSLTYFDDADREPPLRLLLDAGWDEVKADLAAWTRELLVR